MVGVRTCTDRMLARSNLHIPVLRVPAAPVARRPARRRGPGAACADAARAYRNSRRGGGPRGTQFLRHRGRHNLASMAQGARNSSSAQVASTLVCYLNPAIYFAQPLVLFAIDSIINDLCLAILVLTDEEGDAAAARDASGLRVGVAPHDDSPGLELSDGAVLS